MKIRIWILISMLLVSFSFEINSQNNTINGVVKDQFQEPIQGVKVARESNDSLQRETDQEGKFSIEVENKSEKLTFSHDDYLDAVVEAKDANSVLLQSIKINEEFRVVAEIDEIQLIHTEPLFYTPAGSSSRAYDGMMVITLEIDELESKSDTVLIKRANIKTTCYTRNIKVDIDSVYFEKKSVGNIKYDLVIELKRRNSRSVKSSFKNITIPPEFVLCKNNDVFDANIRLDNNYRAKGVDDLFKMSQDQICKFRWVIR